MVASVTGQAQPCAAFGYRAGVRAGRGSERAGLAEDDVLSVEVRRRFRADEEPGRARVLPSASPAAASCKSTTSGQK